MRANGYAMRVVSRDCSRDSWKLAAWELHSRESLPWSRVETESRKGD